MKSNNLMEIMGNISDENLMRAEKYVRAQRSRKIFTKIAAVAACLCIVTGTVLGYSIMSKKDTTPDKAPTNDAVPGKPADDPVLFEFVFYSMSNESTNTLKEDVKKADANVKIGNYSDITFDINKNVLSDRPNGEVTKEIELFGTKRKMYLFGKYTTVLSQSSYNSMKKHSEIEEYYFENEETGEREFVKYRLSDNQLIFYNSFSSKKRPAEGNTTIEEAKVIAEKLFASMYGNETASVYRLDSTIETQSLYRFIFTRYLYGYPTNDQIIIFINKNGELYGINAETLNVYDDVVKVIGEKDIKNAINNIKIIYPENKYTVLEDKYKISIDVKGEFYLYTQITDMVEGVKPATFYMEITVSIPIKSQVNKK